MLLDIPDGSIELPMAAFSTQSVPKTLPHYWLTQKDAKNSSSSSCSFRLARLISEQESEKYNITSTAS